MKKHLISLIFFIICSISIFAQDFYDIDQVNSVELFFTQSNWDQILDQLYAAGEDRLVGTAVINGVTYDSVGVRYKGNSSYNANRTKNPFNIKLDHIIEDQKIGPYGTLKLANGFSDPSFIRETLAYEIARKYMPASKANYCTVSVNGTLIGVYTSVQDTDDYFGETHFYTGDKTRIKGSNDSMSLWAIWGYINNNESSYTNYYEVDNGENMSTFINFLNIFNNNSSQMETVFNVDRHLWMIAFDNLFVNLDAPINFGHNYYVYEDASDRYNSVLWDLNMCFGGFSHLMTGANLTATTMQQLNPLLNSTHASYPILNKVLSNEMYKRMYIAHMRTMLEENVSNGWYATRGAELQTLVGPYVQADPNYFYTYTAFQNNLNSTVTGGGAGGPGQGSTVGITQLMNTRATYLLNHSAFQGTVPDINAVSYLPEAVQANSTITVKVNTSNATSAYLHYRQNVTHPFTRISMYDDGAHGDDAANDGIFGISIDIESGDIQYYIYAENSQQGRFLPARAAYEYNVIPLNTTTESIKINEIMAKNASFADTDGAFDDWVELYNPTDSPINIAGMYMIDNHYSDGIGAWTQIPSGFDAQTTIPAHGYLVVWFDEQLDQGPLHINEKLGGSADAVYLISSDGQTIIDSYEWTAETGLNTDDYSIGRYADGSNNWILYGPDLAYQASPGTSNPGDENFEPEISNISYLPVNSNENSIFTIQAQVEDENNNLTSIILNYGINDSSLNEVSMVLSDSLYQAQIGPFPLNSTVKYKIIATDNQGAECESAEYTIIVGYSLPTLYINELMPSNISTITDEANNYSDWAEIYNPNNYAIDLAGYYLTDSHYPDVEDYTQIPTGFEETIIPAHGYKVLWFDENTELGPLHINTKLGTSGDGVYLIAPDMLSVIDHISWDSSTGMDADISYGRSEDGGINWILFGSGQSDPSTPGSSNQATSTEEETPSIIKVSVYPNPVSSKLKIDLNGAKSGHEIQIFNIKGQLVKSINNNTSSSSSWDTTDNKGTRVSNGIYFLRISSGGQTIQKKICIIR